MQHITYRRGVREFLATDKGGFYADPNVVYGKSEYGYPKSLYEWSVITMKYHASSGIAKILVVVCKSH